MAKRPCALSVCGARKESMNPKITTLSYSAGKQSHALLKMVLMGQIPRPENFLVLNADPGMENSESYLFVAQAKAECERAGIPFLTAQTTLFYDLTTFKERGLNRLDSPPFWTKNRITGKRGRLMQACTPAYKISPINRELRKWIEEKFGINHKATRGLPKVETWIGFSADEQNRANKCFSKVKYITLRFPLIERGMTKAQVSGFFLQHGIQEPPSSVCNACFSNGLAYFEDMYDNRPKDWEQAVMVDDYIRDMRQIGIEDECYVSQTLIPLRELPKLNFLRGNPNEFRQYRCNSGACFL